MTLLQIRGLEAQLQRRDARIAALEAELAAIGAGGVNGPLMGRAVDHFPDVTKMASRWYMVDKDGMATLCTDKADAEREAADAQTAWPHTGPHRAVQLIEADGRASLSANAGGEPVATVFTMEALTPGGGVKYHATIHKALPAGTKLYTHPPHGDGSDQKRDAFQRALSIRTAQSWKLGGDKVPVLYTDEINGEQVHRDDLWLCTTAAFTHPSPPEGIAGWTTLPGQLPESGKPVLLDIGKKFPVRAMWAAKHSVEAADDDTDWPEYSEDHDMYFAPEGWYEWSEYAETNWSVTATPLAWRDLPTAPPLASEAKDTQ